MKFFGIVGSDIHTLDQKKNLISVPILDRLGYSFHLELEKLIYIETLY